MSLNAPSTIIIPTERLQQLTNTLSGINIEFPSEAGSKTTEFQDVYEETGISSEVKKRTYPEYERHATDLLSRIHQQCQLKRYCDVTLQCGTRSFQAHRIILASASAYFDKILADTMTSNNPVTVEMRCTDEEIFIAVMNYIYTGNIRINTGNVKTILITAHVLELNNLVVLCTEFLATRLHPTNCVSILLLAKMLDNDDLLAKCRSFGNITDLLEHDNQLLSLDDKQLRKVISSEHLSEDKRLALVIKWVHHEPHRRQEFIPTLCAFVRVSGLSKSYMSNLCEAKDMWITSPGLAGFIWGAIGSQLKQPVHIGASYTDNLQQQRAEEVIVIAGGNFLEESVECYVVSSSFAHPPHANISSKLPNLPRGRYECAAVEFNGSVFVMGGRLKMKATRSVDILDVALRFWRDGSPMRAARANFGAATLDGKIYAVGGQNENGAAVDTAEMYDPYSRRWRFIANLLNRRMHLAASAVGGKLYAVGGAEHQLPPLASVEAYNPATDSWTLVEPMCTQRILLGACGLGGRLYAVGGTDDSITLDTGEVYNPETNTWQVIAPMKIERMRFGLLSDSQFLYAVGGVDESNDSLTTVERYDPRTNEWTLLPVPLNKLRVSPGFALVRMEKRS